jgi:hypothetical protein
VGQRHRFSAWKAIAQRHSKFWEPFSEAPLSSVDEIECIEEKSLMSKSAIAKFSFGFFQTYPLPIDIEPIATEGRADAVEDPRGVPNIGFPPLRSLLASVFGSPPSVPTPIRPHPFRSSRFNLKSAALRTPSFSGGSPWHSPVPALGRQSLYVVGNLPGK